MRRLASSEDRGREGAVTGQLAGSSARVRDGGARVFYGLVPVLIFVLLCLLSMSPAHAADATHECVFLIDTSASMRENRLVGPLRVALDDFADTIPKDGTSRVWIFTFASGLSDESLVRQLNRTEDLQEAKIFLSEIEYKGTATHIHQALDGVLTQIERAVRDGKSHDFTVHLFTDGLDNGPAAYSFEKNAERFIGLRQATGNALELYYHSLKIEIPPKLSKVIQNTEGMYTIPGIGMPPKARFAPPTVAVTDNMAVTFVDESIGQVDRYEWAFGDGNGSKEENPTHTFAKPGTYTVTLTVSNSAGKSTAGKVVEVRGGPPQAKFTVQEPDKPKYVGEPVRFIDQSTGQITSRAWQFGSVNRDSTTAETEFAFPEAGRIPVILRVTGPFGTDTQSTFLTIEQRPAVSFSFFPKEPVQKKDVIFVNESTGNFSGWRWEFGDGGSSEQTSPVHAFAQAGKYQVKVSGLTGTGDWTVHSAEVVVGTGYVKPVAKFALPVKSIGIGEELTLTDASSGTSESWKWDMGDGTIIETPTATHAYKQAGTYAVSLTVSGPAGASAATASLLVNPAKLGFSVRPDQPRDGDSVTFVNESVGNYRQWKWQFGDGDGSDEKSPQHIYKEPGKYEVTLEAIGPDVKSEPFKVTLAVGSSLVAPKADFVLQVASVEIDQPIVLSHKSTGTVTKVEWNMGDGSRLTGDKPEHKYAEPGEYTITLTVSNATASDSTSRALTVIDVYREPTIAFGVRGDTQGISPFDVTLDNRCAGSIKTFKWEFGDGSTSDDRHPPSHTYSNPGQYTISLTVVDQKDQVFSSTESQNVVIEVLPPPPPPPYPKCVPWIVAVAGYAVAWWCVWTRRWRWSRRNVVYQQDGNPERFASWSRDWAHESGRFSLEMRRTVCLCKKYMLRMPEGGVSAQDIITGDRISDGDRIRPSCELQIERGEHVAIEKLNDSAWQCVVPHAVAMAIAVLLFIILESLRQIGHSQFPA